MRRRDFITLIGSVAAMPLAPRVALAQQGERVRRIGVLMHTTPDEPEAQVRIAAFLQGLQEAGWAVGRNVRIDTRWGGGNDVARLRKEAAELVALGPDVVLAGVGPTPPALQQANRAVPIVFAQSVDPVGNGYVESLARPGGNTTGFTQFEYGLSAKWLELLREVAPAVKRVGVLRESGSAGIGQWAVLQAAAGSLGVEVSPVALRDAGGIEGALTAFAREPNGGLVVAVSALSQIHRELIVTLAARHRLPAVYPYRFFVTHGGLISYGPDVVDLYRRAAGYVDRILKGDEARRFAGAVADQVRAGDQPQDRQALGITVPLILQQRADEVIE